MIGIDEAIRKDQETASIRADRIRLFYPRGQTKTVLGWQPDKNGVWGQTTPDASVDNGFTQWVKVGNDYVNPTDRADAPAGRVLGAGV